MEMDMNPAWLMPPVTLDGSREFSCGEMTPEQCEYYQHRWHFWYIADHVFALPTVAFFTCTIGLFIVAHILQSYILSYPRFKGPESWQRFIAFVRYLSYRGFYSEALRWHSSSIGVLLLGFAGTVFFFCMDLIPQPYYWSSSIYGGSPPIATRSGWMALACMPFIFATAGKANWITLFTGISHERLQVFHRWIAYAFFVLALIHTFPFIVYHVHLGDMESHFSSSLLFYWTGIVALIFQAWLTFMSHSSIRSLLGYEFFKATHFFAVVIFMITFFWHCDYTLSSWDYFIATAAIYVPCTLYTWLRTIFEHRLTHHAQLSVLPNGFIRITIPVSYAFTWTPGQHIFLRFTSLGFLAAFSSHPFTICSSPSTDLSISSELVFYVRHRKGITATLHHHALAQSSVRVHLDGPYGGINLQRFHDVDRLLIIAGGSGAGWTLPIIERFARGWGLRPKSAEVEKQTVGGKPINDVNARHDVAPAVEEKSHSGPSSLRVIMATREGASRTWFLDAVGELLRKYSLSTDIDIQVHVTGETVNAMPSGTLPTSHLQGSQIPHSSSSSDDAIEALPKSGNNDEPHRRVTVANREVLGRPHLPKIIEEEAARAVETADKLGVFVCGPEGMMEDVREAVATANWGMVAGKGGKGFYLHCEHFSWA